MYRHSSVSIFVALLLTALPLAVRAQGWKPEQPVEIIVNCAPGCGPDRMARLMQAVFQTHKFVETAVSVQNRTGGGGAVAQTYLNQFAGNGHYLFHTGKSVLTTHAMGRSVAPYTELTPVANLFGEYIGVAVKADSPIKSGRDLIERLKKDPAALSFGIATSIGNTNHQGVAGALKSAGVDIRKNLLDRLANLGVRRLDLLAKLAQVRQRQALNGITQRRLLLARCVGLPIPVVARPGQAGQKTELLDPQAALLLYRRMDHGVDTFPPGTPSVWRRCLTCRKAARKKSSATCCSPILRSRAATRG